MAKHVPEDLQLIEAEVLDLWQSMDVHVMIKHFKNSVIVLDLWQVMDVHVGFQYR